MSTGIGRRLKRNMVGLIASVAAVAALALTASFTLGGFTASVGSSTASNFSSATVQLEEGNGTTTCFSTGSGSGGSVGSSNSNTTCALNDLTGTLDQVPGGTALASNITITDVGTHNPATASLVTGACTAGNASDNSSYEGTDTSGYCGKVDVTISNTTTGATDKCVYPTQTAVCPALSNTYTLASLASTTFNSAPMSVPSSGSTATYTINVQLDGTAATNADQGLAATIPFTWSISQ